MNPLQMLSTDSCASLCFMIHNKCGINADC